jgi:putative resolvase
MSHTYSLGEFARLAGVHPKTVQRWDRDGTLPAHRTPTGRRFYTEEDRRKLLSLPQPLRRSVAYCRVPSATQKPDLKNQRQALEAFCAARGLTNVEFVEDVGSGLNFKRKAFTSLMDAVGRDEIATLVIAHRDRLVRFGFPWFAHFCAEHGTELLVLNAETLSSAAEMVQDLMTIVYCFSSRLCGLHDYKKSLRDALK